MSSLSDLIAGSIGSDQIKHIAQKMGATEAQAENAISMALPTLLGALASKADDDSSCEQLHQQIQQTDSQALASPLEGLLGGGAGSLLEAFGGGNAGGLLGSLLGGKQQKVEQGLGKASGLNSSQIGSLLTMLAPLVLGALSQKSKSGNLDLGGLKGMLQGEKKAMQQTATGGLLSGLLDQDGDGDFDASDVLSLGMKMFNKQG